MKNGLLEYKPTGGVNEELFFLLNLSINLIVCTGKLNDDIVAKSAADLDEDHDGADADGTEAM